MAIVTRNPYDIAVDVSDIQGRTLLHWTTQEYMYSVEDARLMMKWYVRILENVCWQTEIPVADVSIANNAEFPNVLDVGKGPSMELEPGWQPTLVHRIEKMASKYPLSVALVDGFGTRLSYSEMLDRSLQITHQLVQLPDLTTGRCVGVLLEPCADQVCVFLAVLRLGLVYVPLDLRNPKGRDCPKFLRIVGRRLLSTTTKREVMLAS